MTDEKKLKIKQNLIIFVICFAVSFILLMICSQNSFLYAFNDWVDMNWYVTLGRSVANGKVMYRDIFEQKGPVTYFVFAFLSLFGNTYRACFVLEIICITLFMFFTYKFLNIFASKTYACVGAALVVLFTIISSFFEAGGGAVEEYFLPVVAYLNYRLFTYFQDTKNNDFSKKECVVIGILVALSFWSKYIVSVLFILILLVWFVANLITRKFKKTFINVLFMLLGFLIVTGPVLLYFVVNGALSDLFSCYFYDNLFRYSNGANHFKNMIINNYNVSTLNKIILIGLFVIISALLVYSAIKNRKVLYSTLPGILMFLFLLVILKRAMIYYPLILMPYLAYVLILPLKAMDKLNAKINLSLVKVVINVVIIIAISLSIVLVPFKAGNYIGNIDKAQKDFAVYQILDDINSSSEADKDFYCYMIYDYGFYNVANKIPQEKFYARNNFAKAEYPEMYDYMNQVIKDKKYNFIITTNDNYSSNNSLFENNYEVYKSYGTGGSNFLVLKRAN